MLIDNQVISVPKQTLNDVTSWLFKFEGTKKKSQINFCFDFQAIRMNFNMKKKKR